MSPDEYAATTSPPHDAYPTSPTVTRYPWRATVRTVIVAAVGLLPVLPDIARAANIDTVPVVASVLAVTAAIQRIISTPSVEAWLQKTFPDVASVPPTDPQAVQLAKNRDQTPGRHRKV